GRDSPEARGEPDPLHVRARGGLGDGQAREGRLRPVDLRAPHECAAGALQVGAASDPGLRRYRDGAQGCAVCANPRGNRQRRARGGAGERTAGAAVEKGRVTARGAVARRARRIRLLVTDVDGVLTDGRMVLSERGDELKFFHSRDGVAVALANRGGLRTAFVTGEKSPVAQARADKLGVGAVVLEARRKGEVLEDLCAQFGTSLDARAYTG